MPQVKIKDRQLFIEWIKERLVKYDHTPSALVLMSYYVFDWSEYDKEQRSFTKLRSLAEQQRVIFYQS